MAGEQVVVAEREARLSSLLAQIVAETAGVAVYFPDGDSDLVRAASGMRSLRLLLLEAEKYMTDRLDAIRQIRTLKPELAIVAMSFGQAGDIAAELGCQEALDKPFDLEAVQAILRKYL